MLLVPPAVLANNLGGLGPDGESIFPSLVLGNAAAFSEDTINSVTLLISNQSAYVPGEVANNGYDSPPYLAVSVDSETNVTLRAILVDNTTGLPVKLKSFKLTFVALGSNDDGTGVMQILTKGVSSYMVSEDTTIQVDSMKDGGTSCLASAPAATSTAPADPTNLTQQEKASAVDFTWHQVSEVEIILQVKGGGEGGRTFLLTTPSMVAGAAGANAAETSKSSVQHGDWSDAMSWTIAVCLICFFILIYIYCAARPNNKSRA